jgi:hypothetical protein
VDRDRSGRKLVATRIHAVAGSGAGGGCTRSERALVGVVRLGEPQRHVQRERELEQHERDLAALAASLEDRTSSR